MRRLGWRVSFVGHSLETLVGEIESLWLLSVENGVCTVDVVDTG